MGPENKRRLFLLLLLFIHPATMSQPIVLMYCAVLETHSGLVTYSLMNYFQGHNWTHIILRPLRLSESKTPCPRLWQVSSKIKAKNHIFGHLFAPLYELVFIAVIFIIDLEAYISIFMAYNLLSKQPTYRDDVWFFLKNHVNLVINDTSIEYWLLRIGKNI